jgi:hypothetical protein
MISFVMSAPYYDPTPTSTASADNTSPILDPTAWPTGLGVGIGPCKTSSLRVNMNVGMNC